MPEQLQQKLGPSVELGEGWQCALVPTYLFALTETEQSVEMRFLRLARTGSDYIRISKLPGPTAGLLVAALIFKKNPTRLPQINGLSRNSAEAANLVSFLLPARSGGCEQPCFTVAQAV